MLLKMLPLSFTISLNHSAYGFEPRGGYTFFTDEILLNKNQMINVSQNKYYGNMGDKCY